MCQDKEKRKSKFWVLLLMIIIIGIVFFHKSSIDLKGQSAPRKMKNRMEDIEKL